MALTEVKLVKTDVLIGNISLFHKMEFLETSLLDLHDRFGREKKLSGR